MNIFPLKFLSPLDRMRNLLKTMATYDYTSKTVCKPDIFTKNSELANDISKNKSLISPKSEVF